MSEAEWTGNPDEVSFTVSELEAIGGPCGMTNAQAALIAAAITCAKFDPRGIIYSAALEYKKWLDAQDQDE